MLGKKKNVGKGSQNSFFKTAIETEQEISDSVNQTIEKASQVLDRVNSYLKNK